MKPLLCRGKYHDQPVQHHRMKPCPRSQLLQLALPLVQTYGFTRAALSHSVFRLPKPHSEQLSESAVTALFGHGDDARKTLINAWLDDARNQMRAAPEPTIKAALKRRLRQNEPVLQFLPEVDRIHILTY